MWSGRGGAEVLFILVVVHKFFAFCASRHGMVERTFNLCSVVAFAFFRRPGGCGRAGCLGGGFAILFVLSP